MAAEKSSPKVSLWTRVWDKLVFFAHFFKNPVALSTPMECSRRIVGAVRDELRDFGARRVVELGSGVGSITEGILQALPPSGKLLCVEREKMMCRRLEKRFGRRVAVVEGDALKLGEILEEAGFQDPDALVCSVPLNTSRTSKLCGIIAGNLSPGTLYLQVSFTRSPLEPYFDVVRTHSAVFNIPPERVYAAYLREETAAASGAPAPGKA